MARGGSAWSSGIGVWNPSNSSSAARRVDLRARGLQLTSIVGVQPTQLDGKVVTSLSAGRTGWLPLSICRATMWRTSREADLFLEQPRRRSKRPSPSLVSLRFCEPTGRRMRRVCPNQRAQTSGVPTIQSPLAVAFNVKGDGLIDSRLHRFAVERSV